MARAYIHSRINPHAPDRVHGSGFFCFLLHDLLKSPACHSRENQQAPIRNQEIRAHGFRWQIALLDQPINGFGINAEKLSRNFRRH